jgi:hypothetical protein
MLQTTLLGAVCRLLLSCRRFFAFSYYLIHFEVFLVLLSLRDCISYLIKRIGKYRAKFLARYGDNVVVLP